ncbi:MAG: hypothetical protein R2784_10480 [Saprospiraceae bacterium]
MSGHLLVVETMAPEIDCPANVTINCNQGTGPNVTGTATATDNCTLLAHISINYSGDALVGSGDCCTINRTAKCNRR